MPLQVWALGGNAGLIAGENIEIVGDNLNGWLIINGTAGQGTIAEITSTGDSITITDPEGATTNLEVALKAATGYGLTGNIGETMTPAVDLTTESANGTGNVDLDANTPTQVLSIELPTEGTWLVVGQIVVFCSDICDVDVCLNTVTASFTGAFAAAGISSMPAGTEFPFTIFGLIATTGSDEEIYLNAECNEAATAAVSSPITGQLVTYLRAIRLS